MRDRREPAPPTLAALRAQFDDVEELAERADRRRRERGEASAVKTSPAVAAHVIRATRPLITLSVLSRETSIGMKRGSDDLLWLDEEQPLLDALRALDDAWRDLSHAVAAGLVDDPVEHARAAAGDVLRQRAEQAPEFAVRLSANLETFPIGPVALLRALSATVAARLEPGGAGTRFPELHMALSGYRPTTRRTLDPATSALVRRELVIVRDELGRRAPSSFRWDPHAPTGDEPWDPVALAGPGGLVDAFVTSDGARLVDVLDAAFSASATHRHPLEFAPEEHPGAADGDGVKRSAVPGNARAAQATRRV